MPESNAFEQVPPFQDLEQAAIAAEDMLLHLHGADRQRKGSFIAYRSEADESGRQVEGTIEPYYMYRHEETRVFKVYAAEVGTVDAPKSVEAQFWLMAGYSAESERARLKVGKNQPVTQAEASLVAEFLTAATNAYEAQKTANAIEVDQASAPHAEPSPRFRGFAGRVATRMHLRKAA